MRQTLGAPLTRGQGDSGIQWDQIRHLRTGMVVHVHVQASGRTESVTHEYPLDVEGRIRMPMLGLVNADGLTLQELGTRISNALRPDYIRDPTVNVTLVRKVVAYGALITARELHVRILDRGGNVTPESGSYPVRDDGTLNLPYVGVVRARGRRLDEVEAELEAGYRQDYVHDAVVHLTNQHLP